MPIYPFACDECGLTKDVFARMDAYPKRQKCENGHKMARVYSRINVEVFKPYTEDGFDGSDIEITSKAQRDALLKEHGLNMDQHHWLKKPKVAPAIDEITFGDVQEAMAAGVPKENDSAIEQFIDEGKA